MNDLSPGNHHSFPGVETAGSLLQRRQTGRWLMVLAVSLLAFSLLASPVYGQGEAAEVANQKGFFGIVFSGGVTGAILVFLLLALSIVAAYLVFEQLLSIRRSELLPKGLHDRVHDALLNGSIPEAESACHQNPSFLSFVLLQGISEIDYGWSSVEKAIEDALAEQSSRLFRKVEYLNVIGNIAPMVGLLGTVVGMVFAFQNVATAPPGGATAPDLAEGIYQALVTTVGGLIVAIPSLAAFAIFRNRIDQFVAEAAYLAQHVFGPLRRKKK